MATYIVKKNGERINIIEINPEQVARYEVITGYDLEPYEYPEAEQEAEDGGGNA